MSYPIHRQINPNSQPMMGVNSGSMLNGGTNAITPDLSNSVVGKKLNETKNPYVVAGLTAGIWLAFSQGMEKFNALCSKEYSKTPLGKVEEFGNTISKKILPEEGRAARQGKIKGIIDKVDNGFVKKSKVLNALFHTNSQPAADFAKSISRGTLGEVASEIPAVLKEYFEWNVNTKTFANTNFSELGFDSKEAVEKIIENPHEHVDEIIAKFKKLGGKKSVEVSWLGSKLEPNKDSWFKLKGFLRKVFNKKDALLKEDSAILNLFGKKANFVTLANKLEALKGLDRTDVKVSTLGKILPKGMLRTIEGLTNGNMGGKFAIALAAYFVADSIMKGKEAPKGEKTSTFAENFIQLVAMYMTMPFAMKIMHSAGGLQYIGMKPEDVKNYRAKLENFNKSVANGTISKADYKIGKKALKKAYIGESKFYHRPLKWAARVLTVGLETVRGYVGKDTNIINRTIRKTTFALKQGAGFPMRFGVFLLVIAPFLGNLAVKAGHLVFGRPTKSVLDSETETDAEKLAKAQVLEQAQMMQTAKQQANNLTPPAPVLNNSQAQAVQSAAQAPVRTYIPSSVGVGQIHPDLNTKNDSQAQSNKSAPQGPVRTYVPSAVGVGQMHPDIMQPGLEGADKVGVLFNKADYAEQEALKQLAGH